MAAIPSIVITIAPVEGPQRPKFRAECSMVVADTTTDTVEEIGGWATAAFTTTYIAQDTAQTALTAILCGSVMELVGQLDKTADIPLDVRRAMMHFVNAIKHVHGVDGLFPL